MNIAIIGAGIAGLTAAYDLAKAGHAVTVYEAGAQAGGLAAGFQDPGWAWPLEKFYHHIFTTDKAIIGLANEIGYGDKTFFRGQVTAQWWNGRGYNLNGALPVLRFPALPLPDRVRLGAVVAYLKYGLSDWRPLERTTAAAWTRRWMGDTVYRVFIHPLLEGKFGPYAEEVNMAWLWARFKARSFKLGYFVGGFQGFSNALMAAVQGRGATVLLNTSINGLAQMADGQWQVTSLTPQPPLPERERGSEYSPPPLGGRGGQGVRGDLAYDAVIVTGSPGLLSKLAPTLPVSYLAQLKQLRSMGAVVMTLALKRPLTDGLYWVNMPKDQFPFLALVEHTNFIEREYYGGDHLIYCGDYLEPSHEYFRLTKDELLARFIPALKKVNPNFEAAWIRDTWLHREPYAQPIVPVNHSRAIPPLATPLPGLFWASMSQVYPWDRGTNFAVEIGQRVAREVLQRSTP